MVSTRKEGDTSGVRRSRGGVMAPVSCTLVETVLLPRRGCASVLTFFLMSMMAMAVFGLPNIRPLGAGFVSPAACSSWAVWRASRHISVGHTHCRVRLISDAAFRRRESVVLV